MDKEEFLEDYTDRVIYYRVPQTGFDFSGIWVLSTMFTKWRKERKTRKQGQKDLDESEKIIVPPERKIDTITI